MKKIVFLSLALLCLNHLHAQTSDVQQLLLDIQKLSQLKHILADLQQGYQVLDAGYSAIRDVAKGNFTLHDAFLAGLLVVSPDVRNDRRVADILNLQLTILTSYEAAWNSFKKNSLFRPDEWSLMTQVYAGVLSSTLQQLNDLTNVLTDGTIRASDAERLRQIDAIYNSMVGQASFLDRFNNNTALLAQQRQGVYDENQTIQNFYTIKP